MKIIEVYSFYNEYIKPTYSEIEARWNTIPVELLFETYAAFDHVKRFYLSEESESESAERAISHLKRGLLDAFKLKLKYFNTDIDNFLNAKVDLQLIDNGEFISSFYRDRQAIIKNAKKARLTESQSSKEEAFSFWFDVSLKIDDFEKRYFSESYKFEWARKKTFEWLNKDAIKGFVIGLLSGVFSSLIIWWFTK